MPTPTLPIATLATANTFRQWLARTNTVIDLINSNTVFISGYTSTGVFTLNKDAGSSLNVANSVIVTNIMTTLKDNPVTISSNVVISTSAKSVTFNSNTVNFTVPNGVFVNTSLVTLSSGTPLTTYSNVVLANTSSSLTVAASAFFNGPAAFTNASSFTGPVFSARNVQIGSGSIANATTTNTVENNYTNPDFDTASVLQLQPTSGALSLTGLLAPSTLAANSGAKILYLYNTGTYKITLKSANTNSDAANQFKISGDADFDIPPGVSIPLIYTSAVKKWVPLNQLTAAFQSLQVSGDTTISGTLNVTNNTTFNANLIANTTTNTLHVNVLNNRVGIGRVPTAPFHVSGSAIFDSSVSFSSAAALSPTAGLTSGNTTVNSTVITLGNTTVNTVITGTSVTLGPSVALSNSALSVFGVTANSLGLGVGANVAINVNGHTIGNTTVNSSITSSLITVANTTAGRANLEPGKMTVGTSVVNTSAAWTRTLFIGDTSSNISFTGTSTITISTPGSTITRDLSALTPTGTIVMYGGTTAPAGWLLCQGQALPISAYPALYAAISSNYGSPGAGYFNLPDLQQRFPMGGSGSVGATGGSSTHSHTYTQVINHTHTITIADSGHGHSTSFAINDPGHTHSIYPLHGGSADVPGFADTTYYYGAATTASPGVLVNTTGITLTGGVNNNTTGITASSASPAGSVSTGTTSQESTLPPYVVVNYMIKT